MRRSWGSLANSRAFEITSKVRCRVGGQEKQKIAVLKMRLREGELFPPRTTAGVTACLEDNHLIL